MFWWSVFGTDLLIPLIITIAGAWLYKFPPKKINSFFGYRTSRSMKDPEAWFFAQKYCGKLWFISGAIMIPLSVAVHIPFYGCSDDTISIFGAVLMLLQLAVIIALIYPIEKSLAKKFDKK